MDETLQLYLQSIEEEVLKYQEKSLETKEYLQSMQQIQEWLEGECNADTLN